MKSYWKGIAFGILFILLLAGCNLGNTQQYTLTIYIEPVGSGAVNPSGGTFDAGTSVTLTPTPVNGYVFDSWGETNSDQVIDLENGNWRIRMDGNKSLTAVFVKNNQTPIANDDTAEVNENDNVLINVLTNDTDPDGDSLSVIAFSDPENGTISQEGSNLRYTPNENFYGTDIFTYEITDGNEGSATATVTITVNKVNEINQTPVANDDTAEVTENDNVLISVLANDTDPDGDSLSVIAFSDPENGTITQEESNLRYTPNENFYGTDIFTYEITDGNEGSATATVTITVNKVNEINQTPVANDDTAKVIENNNILIDVLANDTDPDGDSLSIIAFSDPENGTISQEGSNLRYTPNENFYGTDIFTYEITDGNEGSATATVTITVNKVNQSPIANDDTAEVTENDNILIDVLANDTDPDGDSLTITSFSNPENGTIIQEDNSLRYSPDEHFSSTDSFTYEISDGNEGSATATVTITVNNINQAPVANDDTAEVTENDNVLIGVLANDTDPDGDSLTITSFSNPENGTIIQEDNSLRYSPDEHFSGTDSFTYEISDGNEGTATATVTITVNNLNQIPVTNDDTAEVTENDNILIDVLTNDTDPDGDTLSIIAFSDPENGTVTQEMNSLRYTPKENFCGTDSFTYDISDGNEGLATGTVTITVTMNNNINHNPIANNNQAMVNENSAVLIHVLANDSDPDGDTLTITSFSSSEHGTVTQLGDDLRYSLYGNFYGTDTFTYEISDGNGGTATATVTIIVNNINQTPVANDDTAEVNENSTVLIDVLANDIDPDEDSLSVLAFSEPENGSVTQEGNSLRYTPNENFYGTDTFTYDISDGIAVIVRGSVTITVNNVNQPPLAFDDYETVHGDDCGIFNVLGNDTDPDNDTLTITEFNQGYYGGSVEKYLDGSNRITFLYTPKADIDYDDEFTYIISDGNGGMSEAIVFVTVVCSNHNPVANDDSINLYENESILIDVLNNDTDDLGDTFSIETYSEATHGTVSQEGEQLRYTPDADYNGTDSFTYTVIDNHGASSNTATVNLTVKYKEIITINDTVAGGTSNTHNIFVDQDKSIKVEITWDNGQYIGIFLLKNGEIVNGIGDHTSPNSFSDYLLSTNNYAIEVNAEYNSSTGANYTLTITFTL